MTDTNSINIPIVEPIGKIRFTSRKSLVQHVQKHVLDKRLEYWSQLIDPAQIAEARREIQEQLTEKPMFKRTILDYLNLLRKSLIQLTKEGKGHQHLYWEPSRLRQEMMQEISEEDPNLPRQTVEAWDLEKKILIVAKSFVRNGKFSPYVLCTGYRPFPKLSGSSLQKNIKKNLRERPTILKGALTLALHDE